jgi:hypothetical protein
MGIVKIIGLEGQTDGLTLQAQFNPKEISVDRVVNWAQQPKQGPADLEYVSSGPMTMAFELLFDGFETGTPVQPNISKLQQFCDVDPGLKRPPRIRVVWGLPRTSGVIPAFDGVIEALSVRYVMFDANGVALRATVNLRLKEADKVKAGQPPTARGEADPHRGRRRPSPSG